MALTTGVVSRHTVRRFFRQSCPEKLPPTRPLHMGESTLEPGFLKGRLYGQVCFIFKKNRYKNSIRVACFFSLNTYCRVIPLLAIWLLPRDSHYGQWPRSGEIDLMETKGMDTVIAYVLSVVFNRKGVHYLYKFEMF